jgi:hypothetical protein
MTGTAALGIVTFEQSKNMVANVPERFRHHGEFPNQQARPGRATLFDPTLDPLPSEAPRLGDWPSGLDGR